MADLQVLYRKLDELITLLKKLVEVGNPPTPTCECHSFGPDGEFIMKLPTTEVQHD